MKVRMEVGIAMSNNLNNLKWIPSPPDFNKHSIDLRTELLNELDECSDVGRVAQLRSIALRAAGDNRLAWQDFLEVIDGITSVWKEIREGTVTEINPNGLDDLFGTCIDDSNS